MGDSKTMDGCHSRVANGWVRASRSGQYPRASFALRGLLLLLVFTVAGCEGGANKKSSLTDEEIQRLTFAPKPTRPDALVVSGETITCEDVFAETAESARSSSSFKTRLEELAGATTLEQFMEAARPRTRQLLNSKISNIVLYQRARRELGEKIDETLDGVAEKELRRFVLEHGGNNAQADEALNALGLNRSTFKEYKKKQILAQYSISSKLPKNSPITYSEMMAAYDQMKDSVFVRPGEVQFRLIDIQAGKMELTDPNEDSVGVARTLAESLVTRICAGEDFGKLAEEYSHGHRQSFGGLWTARDPESLAEPYAILAEKAKMIEVDEIAGPIDVPNHAFIMKLEGRRAWAYLPLSEVQERVEERIRTERRLEALKRLDEEVAEQTAVADTDPFLDDCLERLYRATNASPAAP
jgi:parvulin-like peptidyl-prolyl isomerase